MTRKQLLARFAVIATALSIYVTPVSAQQGWTCGPTQGVRIEQSGPVDDVINFLVSEFQITAEELKRRNPEALSFRIVPAGTCLEVYGVTTASSVAMTGVAGMY